MILTLNAKCLRPMLAPAGKGKKTALELFDIPKFARETLGLSGLTLSTDLLIGADRAKLDAIRERADRVGCACLLLVESEPQPFGHADQAKSQAAIQRMTKVVEAAHLLGCSAAAVKVQAPDDESKILAVAAAMKHVVTRAEKLDISLLISPHTGMTSKPERVTELLKKIGGFRIGTFPDFLSAAEAANPTEYLHRLTPYASAVCATTVKLLDPVEPEPPGRAKKSKHESGTGTRTKAPAKKKTPPPKHDTDAPQPAAPKNPPPTGKGKKASAKAAAKPVEPEPDDVDIDDASDEEIEALIAEAMAEEAPPPLIAHEHEPYVLRPLINAVVMVGYDGALTIDYRGEGDVVSAISKSRDTLLALIEQEKNNRVKHKEED
jgi:sugar phosphate isomerase/epimerase